jgi:hypothetical protein
VLIIESFSSINYWLKPMSEWFDKLKKPASDSRKKLAEHMAARKRRKLTAKDMMY